MALIANPRQIDHIVWAVPDLSAGIAYIEDITGEQPVYGGRHLQFGTHNALLRLGNRCYFEILAPDPENNEITTSRWMGIDLINSGRITRWALSSSNLSKDVQHLITVNSKLGQVEEGQRLTASEQLLCWQLSIPLSEPVCEPTPFLIDWQNSVHPADNLTHNCTLVNFKVVHPNVAPINQVLNELGSSVEVVSGQQPKLELTLSTPKGMITIV
ncbi:MAG: VOC family protein [Bacteroidota bacterium]